MRRVTSCLCAVLCLLLAAGVGWAQPPSTRIPRVSEPPVLERYVEGKTVPPGVRVSDFKQRVPGDGTPASVTTDVYLS